MAMKWIFAIFPWLIHGVVNLHHEHVCGEIDVRNQVNNFKVLENCTVIEGSLSILLIDYAHAEDYTSLSFPKLREITEYLLLYRVYGLKTLGHMFPNLSVIRGHSLFFNYALVAFEMPDLEMLGLSGLTHIERGAVRLEKNSVLCYVDTIDWSLLGGPHLEENFIMQNKEVDECVNICPKNGETQENLCHVKDVDGKRKQPLCWNSHSCQTVCPTHCGSKTCFKDRNNVHQCCDSQCVGGCSNTGPSNCFACRHVLSNGVCVSQCPPNTFKYKNRRCITEAECRDIHQHFKLKFWKVHNGECIFECPTGYTEDEQDKHQCKICNGSCPKECHGMVVDHIDAAHKLRGCTKIKGVLEISISGGKLVGQELEEGLGAIEEVTQYVRIIRSYAIVSLSFLKNLRRIGGERKHNEIYSLFVLDNENLHDIWDFDTHPRLELGNGGRMFFHFNRKLCPNLINQLVELSGVADRLDETDISPTNNGDQVGCEVKRLNLTMITAGKQYAIVTWSNYRMQDNRELLGWIINYREAKHRNITIFSARDACGEDVWKSVDTKVDNDQDAGSMATLLFDLKPFTQYAVYIQTYTVATAHQSAISSIEYFVTQPDFPTYPRDIEVLATSPGELHVSWKEPSKPNGNVTHYYVYWQPQTLHRSHFDQRDYCYDKLRLTGTVKKPEQSVNPNITVDGQCCTCPKTEEEERLEEDERNFQIRFENYLHNSVYIKRPMPPTGEPYTKQDERASRHRRSSGQLRNAFDALSNTSINMQHFNNESFINITHRNVTDDDKTVLPYRAAVVHFKTEIVLPNLSHFQEYSIEVIACHDSTENSSEKLCSNRAITTARTLPQEHADNIDINNATVQNTSTQGSVMITWPEPLSPNGLIVTYEVEYKKVDVANISPLKICITHKTYRQVGGYQLDQLAPGNYSYKLRSTSLAGNGSWTELKYFYVPELYHGTAMAAEVIAGISASCVILIIVLVAGSVWVVAKKRFNPNMPDGIIYASVNPEYMSAADVYVPDEWEVPRDKIELLRELGQGSFGMVYEGIAKGSLIDLTIKTPIHVAVKTVNEKASARDRIEFLNEASVMKAFTNGAHVVKLLGVVSKGQPTLVIMELMSNGDLKTFLRHHRPDDEDNRGRKPPTLSEILQMAGEIADGMTYLAAKKFVHRDLAARNCMVAENLTVKVGDFGMVRDIYETDYYRKGDKGLLPVRWMSPESLKDGLFTSQSDVWSFGVVMWEMATLAAQPYQGLSNEQVLKYVIDGGIMDKPEGCPEKLYDLMMKCWNHSPKYRPTFSQIVRSLSSDTSAHFRDVSYYYSKEHQELLSQEEDDDAHMGGFGDECHTPLSSSPHNLSQLSSMEDELHSSLHSMPNGDYDEEAQLTALPSCRHQHACNCVELTKEDIKVKYPHRTSSNHVQENSQSNNVHPNEGSKGSSKSSGSSNGPMNGLTNGHIPKAYYAKC